MKSLSLLFVPLLLVVCLPLPLRAQQPSAAPPPSGPVFGGTDQFDAMGIKRYRLGPGDVLDLRVYGQAEFNGALSVDDDGYVELPFVDKPIFAKCRTDRELRAEVTEQLKKYIKRPQVSLRVIDRRSRPPAVVYGAVRSPQRVMMFKQVRLLELLAVAGGVTEAAGSEIQIFHTQRLMCPDEEAADLAEFQQVEGEKQPQEPVAPQEIAAKAESARGEEVVPEDPLLGTFTLYSITELKAGKAGANPVIRPGDIVIVQEANPVYVTGAVYQPQALVLRDQLSLRYAIAQTGGLRKDAKGGNIRIYRRKPGTLTPEVIKVDFNAIKNQKQPDIALQAYDVVDIPSSVVSPANILNTLLGTGVNAATSFGGALPLRMLY